MSGWCSRHARDCGAREGHTWCIEEVPFGEIEANPSDPKHVGWPMRPSDGLGVLGLTGLGVMEPL